jgi:hydroxymethylpyrimidine pyrophosphatase-like HAD family hydrolase
MNVKRLGATGVLDQWRSAYREFLTKLSSTPFRGVVLDYDGTMCSERDRFRPLPQSIVAELNRLMRGGLIIGVATGRGRSVRQRLREAVLPEHWSRTVIGYYNGGDIALLQDEHRPNAEESPSESLRAVADALRRHRLLNQLASFEFRIPQVTVEARRPQDAELIWDIVQQLVIANTAAGISLLRSSHSMDIVAAGVSKVAVVQHVAEMAGDPHVPVLCVGDKGRYPGNDHLLLGTSYGLSVDEPAPDVGSGWNLAPVGYRGVDACVNYLRRLRLTRAGARFAVTRS